MTFIDNLASIATLNADLIVAHNITMISAPVALDAVFIMRQPTRGLIDVAPAGGPELTQQPTTPGMYTAVDGTTAVMPEAVVARRRKDRDWPAVYLERKGEAVVLRVVFDLKRPAGSGEARSLITPATAVRVLFSAQNGQVSFAFAQVEWRDATDALPDVIGQIVAQTPVDLNQVLLLLQTDTTARFDVTAELNVRVRMRDANTISLIDQAAGALWIGAQLIDDHNGIGDETLPWNGSDGDARGFVRADGITMEDGQWRPRVLRTHPKWLDRSTIKGWLPWFSLPAGARFEAEVGFVYGASNTDGVVFWVWIHDRMQGSEQWHPVVQLFKRYDGQVTPVVVDLSNYGGNDISVELRVDAGASSGQDWAAWSDPRIVSPAQAENLTVLAALAGGGTKACFPPNIRANKPIYLQVTGAGVDVDIDADWIQSPAGEFKETGIAGQFFVLPDAYGLAFDAKQSQPAMTVVLVPVENPAAEGSDAYRVRVRLAIVPDNDARRHDLLREWIRAQPLNAPYAALLVGGYEKALFKASDLFSDLGLRFVGASTAERPIDARGFELILDCTLEAYTFLTELLTTAAREVRIGEVELHIRPDGAAQTVEARTVPVWLRLDQPAGHPLTIEMPKIAGDAVKVKNLSSVAVNAEAHPAMLYVDPMTGETVQALVAQPQALALQPGEAAALTLTPENAGEAPQQWSKVAVSLWNVVLTLDSAAVLSRAHQLASRSSLRSKVRVYSYLLKHPDQLRIDFPNIYGIDVELRRGSAQAIKVSLTLEQADTTVPIDFSLLDLLNGLRPEQPSFEFRQRNLRTNGAGNWTAWEASTGRELQVAPLEGGAL